MVQYDLRGNLDSCITIRSAVISPKHTFVQTGAGIVADSKAEREFHEIFRKSLAVRQALDIAGSKGTRV
jgi:anthranilate synthase component I